MKRICCCILILIIVSCNTTEKEKEKDTTIGIQPFGIANKSLMDTIASALRKTYHASVVILPDRAIPKHTFTHIKSLRYRADLLLSDLKKNKPDSIDFILGLTHKDISTTKRDGNGVIKKPESKYADWGIFGLGYRPGPSCMVSTFRLNSNKNLLLSRLKKVSIHELGHNMGLNHCPTEKCVMQDAAETIKTIDSVGDELCTKCRSKL